MADSDFKIPKSLRIALKEKRVVPFVGAGASIPVKKKNADGTMSDESLFPSWKDFVKTLAQTLRDENKNEDAEYVLSSVNIPKPKYLEALQHAKENLKGNVWHRLFDESFLKRKDEVHPDSFRLNELIWKLANNLIITTNVDRVFQWTCPQSSEFTILDAQSVEYSQLRREKSPNLPTVWHLHGHITNKDNVIFTREQFDLFYKQRGNEAKLQTLIDFLTERTIIFIGFSLDDAYLREILENINDIYKSDAASFYILFRERDIASANFPKYVEPVPFSDFGKPLEDLVEELARIAKDNDDDGGDKFGNGKIQSQEDSELGEKEIHFNVPFASKRDGFVGREGKIVDIWNTLTRSNLASISQAVSIAGFGGLGKTQLAVEYAYEYRDKYPNGVFWITADEDISVQLIKIGESLKWISQFDKDFDQAELVRKRFRKITDCLIIFDNVDAQNEIKDYLPEAVSQPHILVTSREEQHGFMPINLDTLSLSESRELFVQIAERSPKTEEEEKALENILKELDGLPLAVELVGGYFLRRKTISFQDYYEHLEKESIDRIEKNFPDNPFTKRDRSIIRALKISENLLNETEYLEEILDILAWSGKSSMGYSLLKELVETNDNLAIQNALGVALELRFIKREKDETRYAIHRLLAKVRQFEKPLKERKDWHRKIVKCLEKWFRDKDDKAKNISQAEFELDHLETWQIHTLKYLPNKSIWLTLLKANPLIERGNYKEAQKFTEEAYELYKKEGVDNKLLLANLFFSISYLSGLFGNYKDEKLFIEKGLNIYNTELLDDEKLFVNLLAGLGDSYKNAGNFEKALKLQIEALDIEYRLFNNSHSYIANSLNNIASTHSELGNLEKALELHMQALDMRKELFGDKHPDIATSLNNIGGIYSEIRNPEKALELHTQALNMRKELFGDKHPDIANSLSNVGLEYSKIGSFEQALDLQMQALDMQKELFGKKHPSTATSFNNLAATYGKLGDHQKAIEYYEIALQIDQELLGNHHPKTILYCGNLILELVKSGYREKAGRLAGEFLSYVPQNNRSRQIFEKYGAMYRKINQGKKKRHRK